VNTHKPLLNLSTKDLLDDKPCLWRKMTSLQSNCLASHIQILYTTINSFLHISIKCFEPNILPICLSIFTSVGNLIDILYPKGEIKKKREERSVCIFARLWHLGIDRMEWRSSVVSSLYWTALDLFSFVCLHGYVYLISIWMIIEWLMSCDMTKRYIYHGSSCKIIWLVINLNIDFIKTKITYFYLSM
jgi:hypothetical protein